MVVANKFQTGFDQPLLAGMFLDKPVWTAMPCRPSRG
jgi:type I site-specific restriction-modification system R (restriction) subunit